MVGDAQRGALRRPGAGAVPDGAGLLPIRGSAPTRRCRRLRSRATPSALNVFGFFAVALLERLAGREPAVGRRAARAGVDRDRRPAGAQPARHRQPAERPGDDRHRRPRSSPSTAPPRRSPASPRRRASAAPIGDVLQLPRGVRRAVRAPRDGRRRAAHRVRLPRAGRPRRSRSA